MDVVVVVVVVVVAFIWAYTESRSVPQSTDNQGIDGSDQGSCKTAIQGIVWGHELGVRREAG